MTQASYRQTRIVATLGPASRDGEVLRTLLRSGVNVIRINCSHGSHASIRADVARVRRLAREEQLAIAILLDLQGPKIRTSKMQAPLDLKEGDLLTVVMDAHILGEGQRCGTTYTQMADDVSVGEDVLFADGLLAGTIETVDRRKTPAEVGIRMTVGGSLGSNKGINLPFTDISAPSLTEKDIGDLEVGIQSGVDYVALSFVRSAEEIVALRERIRALGRGEVPIVAKIEKPEAIEDIDRIVEVVDVIMVARGDLGVEVPMESVPIHQKSLIQRAHRAGVLTITATQMLDSMERNPRPTRAETTDVANAILDGTDAVMLSGETAAGKYPVEAVQVMDRIARQVEQSPFFKTLPLEDLPVLADPAFTLYRAACYAVTEVPRPLIVYTWSGQSARVASQARPRVPIIAFTPSETVRDRLAMVWGVIPVLIPLVRSTDELLAAGERIILQEQLLEPGQEVVILAGSGPVRGATNLVKIAKVGGE